MKELDIEKFIKIKCIEQDIGITTLATKLDMSHQLMWHHIKKKNNYVLSKIERILKIPENTLKDLKVIT
nr:MAG TPA: DNA-binding protein [Caudoviricetes sp.]